MEGVICLQQWCQNPVEERAGPFVPSVVCL